jgi:glycerol transport system substrate-binding protein
VAADRRRQLRRVHAAEGLNKAVDPKEWLGKPDGPKAKLANEKPKGVTMPYEEIVKRWAEKK